MHRKVKQLVQFCTGILKEIVFTKLVHRACVRECRTFSATARRNIFANSKKAEKPKSNNERAKQGQRVFEVGFQISYVSPTGRKKSKQTKFLPGQRRY